MPTASWPLPSTVPGFLVRLYLQALQQFVETAEQVYYRHQLDDTRII